MKKVLIFAAVAEALTGLALLGALSFPFDRKRFE
jgi:hypothetical protein